MHCKSLYFLFQASIQCRVTIGLPAKRHSNGVSLAGRWCTAFRCCRAHLYNVFFFCLFRFGTLNCFCFFSGSPSQCKELANWSPLSDLLSCLSFFLSFFLYFLDNFPFFSVMFATNMCMQHNMYVL